MPEVISTTKLAMFADDSKRYAIIDKVEKCNSLQNDLTTLFEWPSNNELNFQPSKCENLRISRKRHDCVYNINEIGMNIVTIEKDLGILVSTNLKWNHHIKMITGKANRMLGFIKSSCAELSCNEPIKLLYISLVRSHMCFFSQVWAPQSTIYNL